jgi:iron complex outermembrane receptor protein
VTGRWRYIDQSIHSDLVASPTATTQGVPAYNYFDLNAYYTFKGRYTIGVGVTNIGDIDPPFVSGAPLTTDGATYDVVGRTIFASLKAKF